MRKLVFIFLVIVSVSLNAQVFSVGDTSCNYFKIDTVLRCYQIPFGAWNMTKSYSVDLDADMIDDISLINAHNGSSPGSSSHQHGVFTCTSTTGVEFVYNSSATSCWAGAMNLVSNLTSGSPLTASLNWGIATNRNVFDFDKLFWFSGSYYCGHVTQFGGTTVNIGFRKILTGDTIYGWIKLNTTINGNDKIVSYAYKHTASNSTITPVFTNTLASIICEGSLVSLIANPAGGTFYGTGVSGSTLSTSVSGSGNINVYYNKACGTAVLTVSVTAKPSIAFTNTNSICYGDSLVLTATPGGGTFGGAGVIGTTFYSSLVGTGTKTVSYFFTDGNGCSNTETININVTSTSTMNISSTSTLSCPGSTVALSASGASTYTWSTGSNSPSVVVTPASTTVYTIAGQGSAGTCSLTGTTFTQVVGSPTVAIGYTLVPICQGWSQSIYALGNATSYLWSTGSNALMIYVSPSVTTTYTLTGTNPGGCFGTAQKTMTVYPQLSAVASKSVSCAGDTVILTLSGSTQYSIYPLNLTVTTSTVILTPTASITYTIFSTVPNTCSDPIYLSHLVNQCVGVNELTYKERNFSIFPNPNNGEFEIKGTKEETIFITNELGQLITAKNLSQENNFSVKLNNLQSGVYFVGNKFYRQKVVVIK